MECSCAIDCEIGDYEYEELKSITRTSLRVYRCCECNEKIPIGIEYHLDVMRGDWPDLMRTIITDVYRTCLNCYSVRKAVFCNFEFGKMWENIDDYISNGGEISETCLVSMTSLGREMVCKVIEEHWEKDYDEDEEDQSNG